MAFTSGLELLVWKALEGSSSALPLAPSPPHPTPSLHWSPSLAPFLGDAYSWGSQKS